MSFELASGAEGRWTGPPGAQRGRLRERRHRGRDGRDVERVDRVARAEARAAVPARSRFLEVRYRLKSWRRLELCVEDARAAIAAARERGAEEIALLGFSMGGAVAVQAAADPAVSTVIGLAPWLYPQLDVSPLDGRRFAIVHGALDRGLPGVPGVAPELSRRASSARGRAVSTRCGRPGRGAAPDRAARGLGRTRADAPGAALGRARRRGARALLRLGVYRFCREATRLLARLLYRVEIVGPPPPDPCILAANHESMLDPPLLALVAAQPLRFLAKEELWRRRPVAWLMDALGGIPVTRGREGHVAIDRAEELLRAGESVAIFPQGSDPRRRLDARRGPARARNGRPARAGARSSGRRRALSRGRIAFPRIRARRRRAARGSRPLAARPSPPRASSRASSRSGSPRSDSGSVLCKRCHVGRSFQTSEPVERPADPAVRRDHLRRIVRLFRPYRRRLAAVLGLIVFSSALGAIPAVPDPGGLRRGAPRRTTSASSTCSSPG